MTKHILMRKKLFIALVIGIAVPVALVSVGGGFLFLLWFFAHILPKAVGGGILGFLVSIGVLAFCVSLVWQTAPLMGRFVSKYIPEEWKTNES